MKAAVLILGSLALVGCGGDSLAPEIGEEFVLSIGQSATVAGRGIMVSFEDVGEDSRCPADVVCVQAGNATVVVSVTGPGGKKGFDIQTSGPSSVIIADDLELALHGLEPYPRTSNQTLKGEYQARLVVLARSI